MEAINQLTETWEQKRDREAAETKLKYDTLYTRVAEHLPGWEYRSAPNPLYPNTWIRYIVCKENPQRRFDMAINHVHVQISGIWPQRGENGTYATPGSIQESSPSISCSLSRGYEAIAKDIQRRFLPEYLRISEYLRIFAKLEEKIASDQAYEDRRAANWRSLHADPVDAILRDCYRPGMGDERATLQLKDGYGQIRMEGQDSVALEIRSIPTRVARVLLETLAKENGK